MPQIIPFVVTAVTAVTTAVVAAGPLAVAAFNAVNIAAVVGVGIAVAGPLLQPKVGSSGPTGTFKSDPNAPIRGVMGRMAVGGNRVFKNTWGSTNVYLTSIALLSLGPCEAIDDFRSGNRSIAFAGSQSEATGHYAGYMWQTRSMGLPGGSALTPPTGVFKGSPPLSGWPSTRKATGHVTAMWTLAVAEDVSKRNQYPNGEPDGLWIGRWMKMWDPRLDSTYPGGSGPQRRDQWNTWAYTANPYLHAIGWLRGHAKLNLDGTVDRTKRVAGVGAPDRAIDLATYVEGANIADANDWTICGEWSTSDDKWQVLAGMLQAGGGVPLNRGAQLSCLVSTPRASIYTYTASDLIGGASIKALKARRDRKNTVVPRYRSEPNDWKVVPAGAVTSSTYRAEDRGESRAVEIEYVYVGGGTAAAKQAGELGAYAVANMREGLEAVLPSKPHLLGVRAGDAFTINMPLLGFNGQKMTVQRRPFDPATGIVTLETLSETDAKHAWALGQTANPPPTPSLTAYDASVPAPEPGDWTLASDLFSEGGVTVPALVLTGSVENYRADAVIFEFRVLGVTDWTAWSLDSAITTRKEIAGVLTNGTQYEVAVSYRVRGIVGDRLVLGPVTAGEAVSGGSGGGVSAFETWGGPIGRNFNGVVTNAGDTPAITVPSGGRFLITMIPSTGSVYADIGDGDQYSNGTVYVYIVRGGVETEVGSYDVNLTGNPDTELGTETPLLFDSLIVNNTGGAGSVFFRVKTEGAGPSFTKDGGAGGNIRVEYSPT